MKIKINPRNEPAVGGWARFYKKAQIQSPFIAAGAPRRHADRKSDKMQWKKKRISKTSPIKANDNYKAQSGDPTRFFDSIDVGSLEAYRDITDSGCEGAQFSVGVDCAADVGDGILAKIFIAGALMSATDCWDYEFENEFEKWVESLAYNDISMQ